MEPNQESEPKLFLSLQKRFFMTQRSSCSCDTPPVDTRRKIIQIAAAGIVAPFALAPGFALAQSNVATGDRLVEEDAEGAPSPLRPSDLQPGKPMLAFPLDKGTGKPRSESRLNKLVLMRFPEAELDPATRARSAGGVVAYSAICTHQACDVKTWLAKEKALVCFCHASKFDLLDGAKVTGGPASRPLPFLPLALEGDQLVVAGPFSGTPGGTA